MAREKDMHLCSFRKIGLAFRTMQVFSWEAEDQQCLKIWGPKNLPLGWKEEF